MRIVGAIRQYGLVALILSGLLFTCTANVGEADVVEMSGEGPEVLSEGTLSVPLSLQFLMSHTYLMTRTCFLRSHLMLARESLPSCSSACLTSRLPHASYLSLPP